MSLGMPYTGLAALGYLLAGSLIFHVMGNRSTLPTFASVAKELLLPVIIFLGPFAAVQGRDADAVQTLETILFVSSLPIFSVAFLIGRWRFKKGHPRNGEE